MSATDYEFQMGRDRLHRASYFEAKQPSQELLVICHGYKGFKDWGMFPYVAERLAAHRHVITFNFSHNGIGYQKMDFTELEKFAVNTYSRELEDLAYLLSILQAGEFPIQGWERLHLLGHSRGAAVATIHALDYPEAVNGVIGWNSSLDVDLFPEEQKQAMREKGRAYVRNARTGQDMPLDVEILEDMERNRERYDIMGRIHTLQVPLVLIQGSEDFERLKKQAFQAMERNPAIERREITGGNHTFCTVHPFRGTTPELDEALVVTECVLSNWGK